MNPVLHWIDLIWLPFVFLMVPKHHWPWAMGFMISCMMMMRLQVELIVSTGYETGFLSFMDSHVSIRALVIYSFSYILYFLMSFYSAGSHKSVFMAASITIFFAVFFVSTLIMLL